MFQAARHSLRRAVSRAALAPAAGAFHRGALVAGEGAVTSRSGTPSAVAAAHATRFARFGFHASPLVREEAEAPVAKGLSRVLSEELEHERTTYVPSEIVSRGPPEPFEMIESDGDCEITLTRSFGDEEIAVTFDATEDPYEEDEYAVEPISSGEEDEDEDVTIHFTVSVTRGDGHEGLEFSCATDGETVEVRNVRYESLGDRSVNQDDRDDQDDQDDQDDPDAYFSSYPGPNYDELDESVQEEFHKYLEARGIDATLANYIAEARVDKEQREYTRWLENVSRFVK
jgi:complement component 1 Q subcomponent-binding protein